MFPDSLKSTTNDFESQNFIVHGDKDAFNIKRIIRKTKEMIMVFKEFFLKFILVIISFILIPIIVFAVHHIVIGIYKGSIEGKPIIEPEIYQMYYVGEECVSKINKSIDQLNTVSYLEFFKEVRRQNDASLFSYVHVYL